MCLTTLFVPPNLLLVLVIRYYFCFVVVVVVVKVIVITCIAVTFVDWLYGFYVLGCGDFDDDDNN